MIPSNTSPRVDIIIPTYNRAHLIETAVTAALSQSWWNSRVTVVDDASTDATSAVLSPFFDRPDFNYIRLGRNMGTAQAKNVGLALTAGDAVTFHDSDDIPHRDKVLLQVRTLSTQNMRADACLNWGLVGHAAGKTLNVGVALVHHDLVLPDGRHEAVRRDVSLFDDVFPNMQMGARFPGEWTHINSGLFRTDVFARQGGFEDCIEEDREFRNRFVLNGEIVQIIPELLLTKIETPDSLTQSAVSDYESPRRKADRKIVWDKVHLWRDSGAIPPVLLNLGDVPVDFVSNPAMLGLRDMPTRAQTRSRLTEILDKARFGNNHATAAQ